MTPEQEAEKSDLMLLQDTANRLNMMLKADPVTIGQIFAPLWVCDPKLSESTAVIFPVGEGYSVNVLGVVMGCVPIQTDSYTLALEIMNRKLMGFKVVNCKQYKKQNQDK